MAKGLLITGTSSDAGKSVITTGIIRMLANLKVSVAPFKGQNMALNSYVTADGHEIGRAQASQAMAGFVEPSVIMNPVLLKPTSNVESSVLVMGKPYGNYGAKEYQSLKKELVEIVDDSFNKLSRQYDVVIAEGAGSPAEINLLENDLVNLGFAKRVGLKSILVGDIDRGGVFASLYGTLEILPRDLSSLIRGFVINKFRGDSSLLSTAIDHVANRTMVPFLGVVEFCKGLNFDIEDSLGLKGLFSQVGSLSSDKLIVGVVHLPHISNFTDFEPLAYDGGIQLVLIEAPSDIKGVDVLILPGTKATVIDLEYLATHEFIEEIISHANKGKGLIGICGGYQMLTREIFDGIESRQKVTRGLSLIEATTRFEPGKVLRQVDLSFDITNNEVTARGYQIHYGKVYLDSNENSLWYLNESGQSQLIEREGYFLENVLGTSCHGIFESAQARDKIFGGLAGLVGKKYTSTTNFESLRQEYFDRCADLVERNIGAETIKRFVGI